MIKYTFLKQLDYNMPKGFVVSCKNIKSVARFITNYNYSGGHYLTGKRNDNMLSNTRVIILDIDVSQPSNKTIEDVKIQLNQLKHIIAPTKSHGIVKNGIICDRYRILLFLENPIYDAVEYKKQINIFCSEFKLVADDLSKNVSHFFKKSLSIYSVNEDGEYLKYERTTVQELEKEAEKEAEQKQTARKLRKDNFQYSESKLEIPKKLDEWVKSNISLKIQLKRKKFIKILMAQYHLVHSDPRIKTTPKIRIGKGSNYIPQEFFAKRLGVEAKTLRAWISRLIDLKQLEVTDPSYGKGQKGIEYKALNELETAVIDSFYTSKEIGLPPDHIEDGCWDREIMVIGWKYFSRDETIDRFYSWASALPTFNKKKDRANKVKQAWKNIMKAKKNKS